jgi:hypothetical protein
MNEKDWKVACQGPYDLKRMSVGDEFLGCPACHFQHPVKAIAKPICPNCNGAMNVCKVTASDFMGGRLKAKDSLLWMDDQVVDVMEADNLARHHGFYCAEQLVHALQGTKPRER